MSLSMSIFHRLPAVPDDRAERERLLAAQPGRLAEVVAITPTIAKLAAAAERSEPLDGYAERIARAYGKL